MKRREIKITIIKIVKTVFSLENPLDFFSTDDLRGILNLFETNKAKSATEMLDKHIEQNPIPPVNEHIPKYVLDKTAQEITVEDVQSLDDRALEEKRVEENSEDEIYSIKNFSI